MLKQPATPQIHRLVLHALAIAFTGSLILSACGGTSSTQETLPPVVTFEPSSTTASTGPSSSQTSVSTTAISSTSAEPTTTGAPPDTEPCLPGARPAPGVEYQVVDVADDDVLNIRQFPGHRTTKVGALGPNTSGIRPTGRCAMVGTGAWWELDTGPDGSWVNSKFLAPS